MDTTPHTSAELALYSAHPDLVLHWLSTDAWVPYDPAIVHRMRRELAVLSDRAAFYMYFNVDSCNGQPRVTYTISFADARQVRTSCCDKNCPESHVTSGWAAMHVRALKFLPVHAAQAVKQETYRAATETIASAPKAEPASLQHFEIVLWSAKCDQLINLSEELCTQPQCESCSCEYTGVPTEGGPDHSPYTIRGCFHTHCHDCVVGWLTGSTPMCRSCCRVFTSGDLLLNSRLIAYIEQDDDSDGFEHLKEAT